MGSTLRYNTHQSAKTSIGKLSMHFTSAFVTLANSALPGLMPSWRIAYSPGEAFSIRGKRVAMTDNKTRIQFISGVLEVRTAMPALTVEQACEQYAASKGLRRAFWAALDAEGKRGIVQAIERLIAGRNRRNRD